MPSTIAVDARLRELISPESFPPTPGPGELLLLGLVVFMAQDDNLLSLFVAYPGVRHLYLVKTLLMLAKAR